MQKINFYVVIDSLKIVITILFVHAGDLKRLMLSLILCMNSTNKPLVHHQMEVVSKLIPDLR